MEELERLQSLHRDLIQLNESRLPNIERLLAELEFHIDDFRKALEKPRRNDKSRQALSSGSIELAGTTYSVNEQFKQETLELAEALDLDELEAARLYLLGEEDSNGLDRSALTSSIILFHQRREFLLESLRLTLYLAAQPIEEDNPIGALLAQIVGLILQGDTDGSGVISGAAYWRRCFAGMGDVEKWLQNIAERVQSVVLTGQIPSAEFTEVMSHQRDSLLKQHESLGAIVCHLIQGNHTNLEDFETLLTKLKSVERYDAILIHYIPSLAASVMQFASSPNNSSEKDARRIQDLIITNKEQDTWALRNFQAAAKVLWLADYSARFKDEAGNPRKGQTDEEEGPGKRSAAFMEALRDGAFQFLLSVSRDIKDDSWFDPLRHGITSFLTHDTPALITDPFKTQKYFADLVNIQLQAFVQSYIAFMPDTLRQLKVDEDEQRRQMHTVVSMRPVEQELHLERFLIIIAYAYDGFPDSAETFWQDHEGNLFGFLQWASQRQSTPRIASFVEMLRALSDDEICADYAHEFLLGEMTGTSTRSRRNSPLSWTHIFNELEFYSSTMRERSLLQAGKPQTELVEPESAMMLECYLRLLRHLAARSPQARNWLITHTGFRVHEHLLLLCGSSGESRLRACGFSALAALLVDKEKEVRDSMWSSLDAWISGGSSLSTNLARPPQPHASSLNEQMLFEALSTGFEEPNAFIGLLQALVSPDNVDGSLKDGLPFPESLGSAYRMPGIEPYVDFVLGRVFGAKSTELRDPTQIRILRWNCLNFSATCLSSFNEGLVVFANRSNISVDTAIRTSSLATYARIHPFSRVMEWFFNEAVIASLFATTEQNMNEVNEAAADSPLVLSLVASIEVIDLILSLQTTYFEIIRPIVKLQSANRKQTVANSALASFEDAILNNINIVNNLGLYCGTGHERLVIASIRLLQKLCSSRKLSVPLTGLEQRVSQKSRLIIAMERNNEAESVSRSLVAAMKLDAGELEQGATSPGLVIKTVILKFLNESLAIVSNRPTVAHLLLGFTCHPTSLDIGSRSLFARGDSLLHAIAQFLNDSPSCDAGMLLSWLTTIRNEAMQLLSKLWRSELSSQLVLPALRHGEFLFGQWVQQPIVARDTLWDGRTLEDPDFFLSESAAGYIGFLQHRTSFLEYIATELKSALTIGSATLRTRIQSCSLGVMIFLDGHRAQCPTLFDFTDFLRLELGDDLPLPESQFFSDIDFSICQVSSSGHTKYDLRSVEQLLLLKQNVLRQGNQVAAPGDEKLMEADFNNILQCFLANNNRSDTFVAHIAALEAWARLILVFLECSNLETAQRNAFILQGVQLILPYLETSLGEDMTAAFILARLGRGFLDCYSFTSPSDNGSNTAQDSANDRLFQLFRVGLVAMQYPDSPRTLRETCYVLCNRYLTSLLPQSERAATVKHALQSMKTFGDRLIEVICDDAYGGDGSCRIAALLLLGSVITASNQHASRSVVEAMTRCNFIQVMVDNLRGIPDDIRNTNDPSELLSVFDASLALLLRIAQTRSGAACVMSAGIFSAVKDSGLFDADPDIGLDVENPKALTAYFKLIQAIVRILASIVLSRGAQNDHTISEARLFLQEHRMNIMAIFKRSANIGMLGDKSRITEENGSLIQELVDNLTILISSSDFLATEQQADTASSGPRAFT